MARHLSTKQLTSWLNGGSQQQDEDEHIDTCSKCAARVERISADLDNVTPIRADLAPALLAVLRPPEDLHARMSERMAERLQSQSDMNLFGTMFGIPTETIRVLGDSNFDTN